MDDRDEERLRGLMVAYQAGSYEAFEGLYVALAGRIRGWLTNVTGDPARAEDLTQETFLQLHRARHTYDPSRPVMPWAIAIARHMYLMDRRTASRRPRLVGEEHAPQCGAVADAERYVDTAPVRRALANINPERREAMLLHHVGGWSFREIARKLRISETAAKLRSSRGVGELREALRGRKENHD